MNKYFFIILILFITSCSNNEIKIDNYIEGDTVIKTFYNSNGLKKYTIIINKKTFNSEVLYYNLNGKIELKENYINGKRNGISIWYHKNGIIRTKMEFINDTANGFLYQYYKTGELLQIINFYKGEKRGESEEYYKNQELKAYKFFDLQGRFVYEKTFDTNGNTINERGSGIADQSYNPSEKKVGDTLYVCFVFALPPNCERELLFGEINNKNEIVKLKPNPINEDFLNEYKIVYNKKGIYRIGGYFRLIDKKNDNKVSQWRFVIPNIIVN